jgi:citrate lyase subunit beta/citryl-CoA lyase
MLPKVEYARELQTADWVIGNLERGRDLPPRSVDLIPIIETAIGFSNLRDICGSQTRVRRLAFGAGDFTLDMGMEWTRDETELLPHRAACVLASRAAGLEPPVDTVWADLRDTEGFATSAKRAAGLGFQGKTCIHPDQIVPANAAFTPDDLAIARARRIVAAFEKAEAAGLASIQLDGQFIDYPIVQRARRVLGQGGG